MIRRLFAISICLLLMAPLWAETPENLIENYDLRSYLPQAHGLKDLYVRIDIPGLTDTLNGELRYGKLDDVYFEVYWQAPGQWHIEVKGMPEGFVEKKTAMAGSIVSFLGYIIPQKLLPRVSGYALTLEQAKEGYVLKGEDKANVRGINKIEMNFDQQGRLSLFKFYSPVGVQGNTYFYKTKSWSQNKWVIEKLTTEMIQGFNRAVSESTISYTSVAGFGFPENLKVVTRSGLNNGKELDSSTEAKVEVHFKNYEANSGKASKFFSKNAVQKKNP